MNTTNSTDHAADHHSCCSKFYFIGISTACCVVTLVQFALESELKDVKRNYFLHSFITVLECVLIFIFNERLIQSALYEKILICTIWTLHAALKTSSFLLFWVQRKLFYRRTALVNNSPSNVRTVEMVIAVCSITTDAFKCGANVLQVVNSEYLGSGRCDLVTSDKWNFVFISWSYLLRTLLLAVMFEPIISHWNRLASSTQANFDFRMKIRVAQPALLSFLYFCANAINVISFMLYRERPCHHVFGEKFVYVQFMPIFYLVAVIIPYEQILQFLLKICEKT